MARDLLAVEGITFKNRLLAARKTTVLLDSRCSSLIANASKSRFIPLIEIFAGPIFIACSKEITIGETDWSKAHNSSMSSSWLTAN